MSRVRGRDTVPEKTVRSAIHRMGYRFRLHVCTLPGNPDIVLPRHRRVVFVHGCFWHGHKGCPRGQRPTSRTEFWDAKLQGNIDRDVKNLRALRHLDWKPLVIWECQTKNPAQLRLKLRQVFPESN